MPSAIPEACHMPDLSTLPKLMPATMIHALIGDPGITHKTGSYRRNFTRLIDKAIREYQLARNSILAQIEESQRPAEVMEREGRFFFILGFTDHLETCLNAVHRVLKLLDRLKAEKLPTPLSRELRRAIEAHTRELSTIRNVIEHIDEYIQRDQVADGSPIMLGLADSENGAVIGDLMITFTDLAAALRKLHEVGNSLFPAGS
jgi:hypothetical protein